MLSLPSNIDSRASVMCNLQAATKLSRKSLEVWTKVLNSKSITSHFKVIRDKQAATVGKLHFLHKQAGKEF